MWGDGTDVRDFLYVADFAEGFLAAVERHAEADPINIVSGVASSINDAVRIILALEGYQPRLSYQPDQPSVGKARMLDGSKATRVLGFTARTNLEEGLRKTMAWYKATLADRRAVCVSG